MGREMADKIVASIITRTFPVTVISQEGASVVLSQGAQAVKENTRYKVVLMGKEMFDPQTNQSLGRMESDCCDVLVERVMPTMAQGRLENLQVPLTSFQPGSLQLRGIAAPDKEAKAQASSNESATPAKSTRSVPARSVPVSAEHPAVNDSKW